MSDERLVAMRRPSTAFISILVVCLSLHAAIIKSNDVLDIQVQSHPEFSGRFMVSSDGTIEYPLLADEPVANTSTSELMSELTFRLAKHIDNPLVLISIVEKPDITVTVLGQVQKPGPVTTYLGATVQEVIQLAGGPLKKADMKRLKIIHKGDRDEDAEIFDLSAFMKEGNMNEMPRLAADDVIILQTEEQTRKVKVIGAVNKPGFYELEEKMSLFEIVYLAGGPAEKADLSRVRRFFKRDGKTIEEVVNIQSFIDKGKMDSVPLVEEGDIVIVYSRWFDWKAFMTILSNILLFIVTIQALRGTLD